MATCKQCGDSYDTDDCLKCKTVIGLNIAEISNLPIKFVCENEPDGHDAPAVLEASNTGCKLPVVVPVCKFGRDPECDISVTGVEAVSRLHFMITFEQGYFYIMDLGSTNGTLLHGKPLTERTLLTDGSEIEIGPLHFRFVVNAVVDSDGSCSDFLKYLEKQAAIKPPRVPSTLGMTADCPMPDEARKVLDRIFSNSEHNEKLDTEELVMPDELDEELSDEADELPRYMEPELGKLQKELKDLHAVVKSTELKIRECQKRIALVRGLRKALLASTGDDLKAACARVLNRLGWEAKRSADADNQEFLLSFEGETAAIVRIMWSPAEVAHLDLGKLAISQVAHWCRHRSEPKGILVLGTTPGGKPPAAASTAFSAELQAYATEKNICLVTGTQLLGLFKDVELGNVTEEKLRKQLLDTMGALAGFEAESLSPSAV